MTTIAPHLLSDRSAPANRVGTRQRRRGFTLVELLIVIAIVAVLAALSFMLAPRMRRAALTATSIGNMRQIHVLMMQYTGEHNGQYPISVYQDEAGSPCWRRKIWESMYGPFEGSPPQIMSSMQSSGYSRVMWCPLMVSLYGQDQNPEGRGNYTLNRFFMPPAWGGGVRCIDGVGLVGRREPYIMAGSLYKDDKRFGTFYHLDSSRFPYDTYWSNLSYAYGASGDQALGLYIDGHVDPIAKQAGIALDALLKDPTKLD